jgi:hypothetical protein
MNCNFIRDVVRFIYDGIGGEYMKCVVCGKGFGFSTVGWTVYKNGKETPYCTDCYMDMIRKEKSCYECVFFNLKDSFCKKIKAQLRPTGSSVCGSFMSSLGQYSIEGRIVTRPLLFFSQAEDCKYFLDQKDYVEKAIKGEVKIEGINRFIVCKYCGAEYDPGKDFKCPNCGATRSE